MTDRDETARLRREVARRHHPDLGGDPEEFIRAMRAISAGRGRSGSQAAPNSAGTEATRVTTTGRSRARRRLVSTGRRLALHVRTRIPRSLPGSRRYGHL